MLRKAWKISSHWLALTCIILVIYFVSKYSMMGPVSQLSEVKALVDEINNIADYNDVRTMESEVVDGDIRKKLRSAYRLSTLSTLMAKYDERLKEISKHDYWRHSPKWKTCDEEKEPGRPCVDSSCKAKVLTDKKAILLNLLKTDGTNEELLEEFANLLKPKFAGKKVVFITGCSASHYKEAVTLIESLHKDVFPHMKNFSFVFYDLGLTTYQRSQVERFCECEVRTFPLSALPPRLQSLKCYAWKTLIVYANLPTADTLMWADTSVRVKKGAMKTLLHDVAVTGVTSIHGHLPVAQHTVRSMFDYFDEKTCSFSSVPEHQSGFLLFRNDLFIRQILVRTWAQCAVNPKCMCPANHTTLLSCTKPDRLYHKCHRFDQSALSILLAKLFRGREVTFIPRGPYVHIDRTGSVNYFNDMQTKWDNENHVETF